ncbi:hypothetical protein ACX80I_13830 [Arthrobacter sp. MDT3-44]
MSVLGSALAAATPAQAAVTRIEAESMRNGGGGYVVWTSPDGAKVRSLLNNGSALGSMTASTGFTKLEVRAAGSYSGTTVPQIRVSVDNVVTGTLTLADRAQKVYALPGSWKAGAHSVKVEYINDAGNNSAVLDYVATASTTTAAVPVAPAPVPTTAPAPTPAPTPTVAPAPLAPAPLASATRVTSLHPFSSASFSNTSVGSGIQFAPANDQRNLDLQKETTGLASARWSVRVVKATLNDPIVEVKVVSGSTWLVKHPLGTPIRIPRDAMPGAGTDQHLSVIQPDGRYMVEGWVMKKVDDTHWTAGFAGMTDLTTDGRAFGARASGISQIHGQIRAEEVRDGRINHALSIGIDNDQLKHATHVENGQTRNGVWPARSEDGDGTTSYTGSIPMGSMFAIPASVDIRKLGLTPDGLVVARALQDYGSYVLIRSGTTNLTAEPTAEALYPAKVQNIRSDWAKIRPHLRYVTNSNADTVAGGGVRRVAPLPDVKAG